MLARALAAFAFLLAGFPDARAEEPVRIQNPGGVPLLGHLTRPPGPGPFPAVVLLHSCLGLPADRQSLPEALAAAGYVALFVDDFAGRGLRETCTSEFAAGLADAKSGLRFLAARADVDARRIAIVGFSQGGDTALKLAAGGAGAAPSVSAVAAFYPPCANLGEARLNLPTLVLVGGADDVTPAADCTRLRDAQPKGGAGVEVVVYPRARHLFDDPAYAGGRRVDGMRLEFQGRAARAARARLLAFLAARLTP